MGFELDRHGFASCNNAGHIRRISVVKKKYVMVFTFLLACSAHAAAETLPLLLEGLGLREASVASRDLPGWRVPKRIVVQDFFGKDLLTEIQALANGVEIVASRDSAELLTEMADADIFIGTCDSALLSAAKDTHWVQVYWAGVENCVRQELFKTGDVLLTNGKRLSSTAIADHAIAMLLSLVRGLDAYHRSQSSSLWDRTSPKNSLQFGEITGRTVLIVGLGGIGTEVAKRAYGLGMRVIATRGSRREGPAFVSYVGLSHEAKDLASEADVVINAAPLTSSTMGMFDADFFSAMKSTAYFINIGRGKSVVTSDLTAALKAGEIAGAGLDVMEPEPLPPEHELWQLPRVIITPHVAARSAITAERITALVVENVQRYINGDPLLNVVDVKRGY